jgi:hypothetical protein
LDSRLPLAFVAHQLAERTKTVTIIESTSRKDSFSVPPSRTLSEKPPPGNYCLKVDRLVLKPMAVAEGQAFLPSCRTQCKIPAQQTDDDQCAEDNTFHLEEARSMTWLGTSATSPCETRFPRQTAQGYARSLSKAQQPQPSPWFPLESPC